MLQLRVHPALVALKKRLDQVRSRRRHQVVLTYVTARGPWYGVSWKGSEERSGGIAANIGIHFFLDLLMWLFGAVQRSEVHLRERQRMAGAVELGSADVTWFLSVDPADLPFTPEPGTRTTCRSIQIDGEEIEFTDGFADLHTRVYDETLAGRGFGIAAARPSIELLYRIRTEPLDAPGFPHPFLERSRG